MLSLSSNAIASTLSLPAPPKSVVYSSPFLFVCSDVLTVYDQFTRRPIQQLPLAPLFLVDQPLRLPDLRRNAYSCVLLVDKEGKVGVLDLADADATIHSLLQNNAPFTAFDVLHRNQQVANTVRAPPRPHA